EGAIDRPLKPSFEAVKKPQGFSSSHSREYVDVSRWFAASTRRPSVCGRGMTSDYDQRMSAWSFAGSFP
ncbi:MAG: hypothetical protein ABWY12_04635, partial [Burkholderiales bacterium]